MGLTDKELEALGLKPTAKMVFALIGERLFHRDVDGWHEYLQAPAPPSPRGRS